MVDTLMELVEDFYAPFAVSEYGDVYIITRGNGDFKVVAASIIGDGNFRCASTGWYNKGERVYECAISMVYNKLNKIIEEVQ